MLDTSPAAPACVDPAVQALISDAIALVLDSMTTLGRLDNRKRLEGWPAALAPYLQRLYAVEAQKRGLLLQLQGRLDACPVPEE